MGVRGYEYIATEMKCMDKKKTLIVDSISSSLNGNTEEIFSGMIAV